MTAADHTDRREQWTWAGWHLMDDDTPKPPELSPLASAQSRRAWRLREPAGPAHKPGR